MRRTLHPILRFLALLSSILFVPAAVLALALGNLPHTVLNPELYKRILVEENFYEDIPALAAEHAPDFARSLGGPCLDDPLGCVSDGASPLVLDCVVDAIGEVAIQEIESGARAPTGAEQDAALPCLVQTTRLETLSEDAPMDINPLPGLPPTVQACVRTEIGEEAYNELYDGGRDRTLRETRRINACVREARRDAREDNPGINIDLVPILDGLSQAEWEELIRFVLPPVDMRLMTESAVETGLAYVNLETDSVRIPLAHVKQNLTGDSGRELGILLLNFEPPCTAAQIAQIDLGNFENGGGTALYCAASGEILEKMAPGMQERLAAVADELPEEIVLVEPSPNRYTAKLALLHTWIGRSPLIAISLLVLIGVFAARSLRSLLKWWGIPLLIAGVLGIGLGFAVHPLMDWALLEFAPAEAASLLGSGFGVLGHELLHAGVRELSLWIVIEAVAMTLLGLGATATSRYLYSRR